MVSSKHRQLINSRFIGKRFFKLFFYLSFIFIIFIIYNQIHLARYFPIKEVHIYGTQHLDHQSVQGLVEPMVAKGFFSIDVGEIKERLLNSPWVGKVSVERKWPHSININVVEKHPIARWNGTTLLSSNGELFNPPESTLPKNLPIIMGPEGQHVHMLAYFNKFNTLMQALNLKLIRLEFASNATWNMTFDNGLKISAGSKEVLTRLTHFVKLYPKIIGDRSREVEYIDLRYSNGLAVRWKTIV